MFQVWGNHEHKSYIFYDLSPESLLQWYNLMSSCRGKIKPVSCCYVFGYHIQAGGLMAWHAKWGH